MKLTRSLSEFTWCPKLPDFTLGTLIFLFSIPRDKTHFVPVFIKEQTITLTQMTQFWENSNTHYLSSPTQLVKHFPRQVLPNHPSDSPSFCLYYMHIGIMGGSKGEYRGSEPPPPPWKITKNIGFHRSPEKAQGYQARIQCWAIIGTPAKRHLNGVSLAGQCWPAYCGIWILFKQKLDPLWQNFLDPRMGVYKYST